jgi:hypothetical protein
VSATCEQLGLSSLPFSTKQLPYLSSFIAAEKHLLAAIVSFVTVRPVCTLSDLESFLCRCQEVERYEQLLVRCVEFGLLREREQQGIEARLEPQLAACSNDRELLSL